MRNPRHGTKEQPHRADADARPPSRRGGAPGQGVVRDERGQEQPAEKSRAQQTSSEAQRKSAEEQRRSAEEQPPSPGQPAGGE